MSDRAFHKSVTFTQTPLSFWLYVDSITATDLENHFLNVILGDTTYLYTEDLNTATRDEWYQIIIPVNSYLGQTATLTFSASVFTGANTLLYIDDISLGETFTNGDRFLILYTATQWETEPPSPPIDYNLICNTYATTLGTINYGDGDFVLNFATNIGVNTGITWTIDTDVFRADINTDYTRIGSLMRGKGSKLCGGTIRTFIPDNTYVLTVSTIGDTYLREAATAGANKIYVMDNTHFGTAYGYGSHFCLVVGHGNTREVLEISATGPNGECTILPYGTTTYEHPAYTEVMNLGCFYATGDPDTVDNFISALMAIHNPYSLALFVGSEYIYLNTDTGTSYVKLNDTTVKLFMETLGRDDSYGYSYPHAPGAPVIPNLRVGYPVYNPDSLIAKYGTREAYVNPIGIVDNDTMDKLCWNVLQSGTPNASWGKCFMPASLLPATVPIGDWVYIAESDLSATNLYQIVGLEYDQHTGVFWIELGSTEDYYLESIAGNRGTFDLSLSNY